MTQITEKVELDSSSKLVDETVLDEKPSAASKATIFVLCFTLVLATLAFGMVDAWALAFFCLIANLIVWLWLADAWKTSEFRYSRNLLQLPIFALIVVGTIQLLPLRRVELPAGLLSQSANQSLSLDSFATKLAVAQLAAMLVYLAAGLTFINNQKRLRAVSNMIIIFGFLLAVFGLIQFFSSEGKIYWLREPRQAVPFGPFVNRHHFAACMEMIISLTLGLFYAGAIKRQKLPLYSFAVVVMSVGLLLTGSRGALLSLCGALAFLTLAMLVRRGESIRKTDEQTKFSLFSKQRLTIMGGSFALIAIVLTVVLLLGEDRSLLRSVGFDGATSGDASNGRLQFWQTTLQIIRDNPLGVGLDAFGVAYTRYDAWNGTFRLERAHNDYLQILAEAGIVGLLLTFSFVALLFRQAWQIFNAPNNRFRRGVCIGATAGCLSILIHSFFDFPLRTPSNLLLFLTLTALATVQIDYSIVHRRHKTK